jgi:predicted amidohydrolase
MLSISTKLMNKAKMLLPIFKLMVNITKFLDLNKSLFNQQGLFLEEKLKL